MKTVPTLERTDEPVRDYGVGDLAEEQEQGETDPNSPVVVPNHVRSHGENDCRSGRTVPILTGMTFRSGVGYFNQEEKTREIVERWSDLGKRDSRMVWLGLIRSGMMQHKR